MKPEDFRHTLLDEAHRLRRLAVARSPSHRLDEKTAMWVISYDGWRELLMQSDYSDHIRQRPNRLLGLPVRITVEDSPDTPMIQLVMEPMLMVKRGAI